MNKEYKSLKMEQYKTIHLDKEHYEVLRKIKEETNIPLQNLLQKCIEQVYY